MGRRRCCRWIGMDAPVARFAPADGTACEGDVCLARDELEALRLADLLAMHQDAAAVEMGVSRATFGRIVAEARRKAADALVNGRALRIDGGVVRRRGDGEPRCSACGRAWDAPQGVGGAGACPACGAARMGEVGGGRGCCGRRRRGGSEPDGNKEG